MSQETSQGPYFRLLTEIAIIHQLASNRLERVLPEGLSLARFGVLNHFARLGGQWAPSRLARAFQVTKGAMTNTLQRLEAQGLVRIVADPEDARAKLVEITDAGRAMREACVEARKPSMRDVFDALSPGDVQAVLPVLEKLRKVLDAAR